MGVAARHALLFLVLSGLLTGWVNAEDVAVEEKPWDYRPYRVLIWLASSDPDRQAADIQEPLRDYLMRDFAAIWRIEIRDAPAPVRTAAARGLNDLDFRELIASDPVIAVKKDHPDAIRIRYQADVGRHVQTVLGTSSRIDDVRQRGSEIGQSSLRGVAEHLKEIDGDAAAVEAAWAEAETEALLLSRGVATGLSDPPAKVIPLNINGLVGDAVKDFDKIFLVHLNNRSRQGRVQVVEIEPLMQHVGAVVRGTLIRPSHLAELVGRLVTEAFSPTVRIDDAGTRSATGLLRAGGLIAQEGSPAAVSEGDVLLPLLRKEDRSGDPMFVGRIDFAYLLVQERDQSKLTMELHSGRAGGLRGRKNSRTFRHAIKVNPRFASTLLRLHAREEPDRPLIGYEVYERDLATDDMTLVGRTDWDGRLAIEKTESPLRLLYVKNGGAVLARLPMVPGMTQRESADLSGDDMRLQAEAYIRGVQNAIIDLVAIRQLFQARIRMRLDKGQVDEAVDLLNKLRDQPTNRQLSNDMGKQQAMFLEAIGRNANQRRKIDEMFATTRDLLSKHINPRMLREMEAEVAQARKQNATSDDQ